MILGKFGKFSDCQQFRNAPAAIFLSVAACWAAKRPDCEPNQTRPLSGQRNRPQLAMSFTGAEFGVTEILSYLTTAKTHNYTDYAL